MVSQPRGPLALPRVVEVAHALTVDILTKQRTGPERTTRETFSELSAEEVIVRSYVQQVERAIAEWQTGIDELTIQLELAYRDVRDEASERLDAMQNVCLAARSRLPDPAVESDVNPSALFQELEQLMRDLADAHHTAEVAVDKRRDQISEQRANPRGWSDHGTH